MHCKFTNHLEVLERTVVSLEKDEAAARGVVLSRPFGRSIEGLWDAVTSQEQLSVWFGFVNGDLQGGGQYNVQNSVSGKIIECEPLRRYSLTWEVFGNVSWVDVELEAKNAEATSLTLTHTSMLSPHYEQFGPGATGVGWELGLLGLDFYLADSGIKKWDEEAFATSEEGKTFIQEIAKQWGKAAVRSGEDQEKAYAAASRTAIFFTGESEEI